MDAPAKCDFTFPLSNHVVWIVVTGCATAIVLMMVAACIYLKRCRQPTSANATNGDRRRPGEGKTYDKREGVEWGWDWNWDWEMLMIKSEDALEVIFATFFACV